jgi:hypothetical protein
VGFSQVVNQHEIKPRNGWGINLFSFGIMKEIMKAPLSDRAEQG